MKLKRSYKILLFLLVSVIVFLSFIGLAYNRQIGQIVSDESEPEEENEVKNLQTPPFLASIPEKDSRAEWQGEEGKLVLRSVGDVLIHDKVSEMALTSSDLFNQQLSVLEGTEALNEQNMINATVGADVDLGVEEYNFDPMIARIAPFTSYADYTIANLEIPAAYPEIPISTYPSFNMPASILGSLKRAGVDAVSTATNHTLDKFEDGVYETIDNLDETGLTYYGSFASQEDMDTPRIVEENGISLGLLSYTYGTNGIEPPADQPWVVNYAQYDQMISEVESLSEEVDAVVVSLHLGTEYGTLPDADQIALAETLSSAGAKLILGTHPHDIQPVNWVNDGQTYVMYSHASFMTGQIEDENKVSGIHEVTFERNENGEVTVVEPKFMPIYFDGVADEVNYESQPLAAYKDPDEDLSTWYTNLYDRMQTYTEDFAYLDYLETSWTQEVDYATE